MARLPAQQVAGATRIQSVVVVRHLGHEGSYERGLALVDGVGNDRFKPRLRPQPRSGEWLGHLHRWPVVHAVKQGAQAILQRVVADGVGFTDEDLRISGQCLAPIDAAPKCVQHVVSVQHRLTHQRAARVEVALHVALIDARELLGHRRHQRPVVVDTRQAQVDVANSAVLLPHDLFCRSLGLRIRPARVDRLAFVDAFAWSAWRMDQHGAGIDELLDLEGLQRAQQMPRALYVHTPVARVVGVAEIKVSHQMHHAGDTCAESIAKLMERQVDGRRRREISLQDRERGLRRLSVQPDDTITIAERLCERLPQVATGTGDEDQRTQVGGVHVIWLL